ncbi:MAG: hypothetical protein NVSMB6_32240 [Burkholderiaceae bacterium]
MDFDTLRRDRWPAAPWRRRLALLTASLLLHMVLLGAIDRRLGVPAPKHWVSPTVTVSVGTMALPSIKAALPEPVLPEPPRLTLKRPGLQPLPAPPVVIMSTETPVADDATPDALVSAPPANTADSPVSASAQATDNDVVAQVATSRPGSATATPPREFEGVDPVAAGDLTARQYKVSLPPSARLAYEIRYSTRGNITRGTSVIDWEAESARYAVRGVVTKFGIQLSSFRSEGTIDTAGIEPALYAEKNLRRREMNTHFLRGERNAISFSASTDAYPLVAGAQDRASVLWQLAGIARGDSTLIKPGTVLDVFVAGVRDAEHWLIEVVGEETVPLEHGEARVWHLVRAPRAGTYDKRIDIWLAPAWQWYPVKLRYTEVSGDYLDLSLAELQ